MQNILTKITDVIKNHKKIIIIAVIVLVAIIIAISAVPSIINTRAENSPMVGISVSYDKSPSSALEIEEEDFSVYAVHENGNTTKLEDIENVEFDFSECLPVGDTAKITITYNSETVGEFSCETEVEIDRQEIAEIKCGYPLLDNVIVTLYSNGELNFSGEGDIMTFSESSIPWADLDTDVEITSVSFDDTFTPTNMNYWFEGISTLAYCETIPSSVKTMVKTFYNCQALEIQPSWENCDELLDVSNCFAGCSNLTEVSDMPACVTKAERTYQNCVSLLETPNMSGCSSLTDCQCMYEGCVKLTSIIMCPKVQDMSGMFKDCINLKTMPNIPASVTTMENAFNGCLSLENATNIPNSVRNISGAFQSCQLLSGTLEINTDCENYSNLFTDAALATTLDLQGNSIMMDAYANTSNSGNVLVKGEKPNPDISSYKDALSYAEEQAEIEQKKQQQATDITGSQEP